eukprot:6291587-Alexandrium_andersonii.AAC.1
MRALVGATRSEGGLPRKPIRWASSAAAPRSKVQQRGAGSRGPALARPRALGWAGSGSAPPSILQLSARLSP